ncbi:hypothetical protein NCCP2331_24520 [Sporosarcina sp. NCCP-2331]|nr:hypothetical protein NCCP2331_24520 [Sporosarcina sp. NCCP-2331]GLB56336.1 hypothetical protein NCCP2378_21230 [Sporosarcina sp. NCCP-2378]
MKFRANLYAVGDLRSGWTLSRGLAVSRLGRELPKVVSPVGLILRESPPDAPIPTMYHKILSVAR